MSSVHAEGKRGPGVVRAAVKISLGCVLLGGCSAGTERFTNLEFGSGYEAAPPRSSTSASAAAINTPQYPPVRQAASSQPKPQSGYQLASATPDKSSGYLQVSRVELPPVQQQSSGSSGVKTADGYGPYGPAPLSDGSYAGPRVYSPYDQPNGGYAQPPAGGYPPPPSGYNQPPQGYYGGGSSSYAPPPPPQDPGSGPYGNQAQSQNQPNGRGYDRAPQGYNRAPQDYAYYGPNQGNAPAADGRRTARPSGPAVADASRGKTVRLAPGETILSLAKRHGVTVEAIARANGLRGPVMPGTMLVIPAAAAPTQYGQAPSAPPRAKVAECTGGQCYTVQKGETVGAIARAHGLTEQQLLAANNLPDARSLRAGQSIAIPGQAAPRQAMASATPQSRTAPRAGHAATPAAPASDSEGTLQEAEHVKPSTDLKMTTTKSTEPSCEASLANPLPRMGKSFRKPVEGLVIGQFGPQRDGTVNEGLTISVPKGTPIKAAENGVVAYVGDELPGFGNLILIRHAEEFVTAYAHADEIMVKKCDVVKRGQTIGTAGVTGDANQPQLHFEIRKNSKPVDPSPLLGS
jgi:murein DD-endopeptidase MepM/ murein hydrolase activator NlpD